MNTVKLIISIILLILYFSTSVPVQSQVIEFEHLSLEHGLSQSTVFCMLQDSRGFMWFGTEDGLNQYDGYRFTVYRHNPQDMNSLSNNWINAIHEDTQGTLWIGTEGGGLNRFDYVSEQFTHYIHDDKNINSLSHNTVLSIYEDKQGMLWIGTDDGGLNQFNPKSEMFVRYLNDPKNPHSLSHNKIWSLYEDKTGLLWVGTYNGLNQFDRRTGQFIRYFYDEHDLHSLSHNTVLSIYEDSRHLMWIGTEGGGLNRFDRKTGQFTRYQADPQNSNSLSHNAVWAIYEDKAGALWIGTHGGLNKFDYKNNKITHYQHDAQNPHSLSHDAVWSIYEDRTEVMWVSTLGGLNKFDHKGKKFIHYHHDSQQPGGSLSNDNVRAIYEDSQDAIWIGTYGGGLNRFNRETGKFFHYRHDPHNLRSLSHNNVRAIIEDQQGDLWVGTYGGGLNRFDRETAEFAHYFHNPDNINSISDNNIRSFFEDRRGILWIGTFAGGLNQFDRQKNRFIRYLHNPKKKDSLSNNNVQVIYEDGTDTLWIGTQNGLDIFDRQKKQFIHYTHNPVDPTSLSHNGILSIYEDSEGSLWIGTHNGLNKFNRITDTFSYYTEEDGLANGVIYSILEDGFGNLWLSTNKGLSRFNPRSETFRNYDVSDGLQSNEFNIGAYCKTREGDLFFGGINGFNVFNPNDVKNNPYIPPIVITDLQIFNKSVRVGEKSLLKKHIDFIDSLTLSYRDSVFSFEFAALDYTYPEKNQYAYQLEGFDKEWTYVDSSRRFVTYTNLDAGEYVFKVKGSNNDGVWNRKGAQLTITITPPWWKTWWAYALYIIAILGIILNYLRIQKQKLIESERLNVFLEEKVAERTRELHEKNTALIKVNQEKNEFLGIAAHDLKNPLSAIKGLSEEIQDSFHDMPEEEVIEFASMIQTSAEKMFQLITNLLDVNAIESGKVNISPKIIDILPTLNALANHYKNRAKEKKICLSFEPQASSYTAFADENTLHQVLDNLISNAIKYSPQDKNVFVRITDYEHSVCCEVQDEGPGLSQADQQKLFGKFTRLTAQPTGGEHSTGLGLFIVKRLIEAMKGKVWCESELGKGATFIIELSKYDEKQADIPLVSE